MASQNPEEMSAPMVHIDYQWGLWEHEEGNGPPDSWRSLSTLLRTV